jgi:hypothetical protein
MKPLQHLQRRRLGGQKAYSSFGFGHLHLQEVDAIGGIKSSEMLLEYCK